MTPLDLHPQILSLLNDSDRTLTDLQQIVCGEIPILSTALVALLREGRIQHYLASEEAIAYRLTKEKAAPPSQA